MARIVGGFSFTDTNADGPAVWIKVADPDTAGDPERSVAVIVARPTAVVLVIVAVYLPLPAFLDGPIWFEALDVKATCVSLGSRWPWASVTMAVAVVADVPLATIVGGFSCTVTFAAGPALWIRDPDADRDPGGRLASAAVMVVAPTVVELVIVTVQAPVAPVMQEEALSVTASPAAVKLTVSPEEPVEVASVTVAVALAVDVPFATTLAGESCKPIAVGAASAVAGSTHQATIAKKRTVEIKGRRHGFPFIGALPFN